MVRFLLTGGRSRARGMDAEHQCDAALAVELDSSTLEIDVTIVYESPLDVRAAADASVVFKAGHATADHVYLCTTTEVLVYGLDPEGRVGDVERYVTHPWFNDLHHVRPAHRPGHLVVAATGLDAVLEIGVDDDIVDAWAVIDGGLWERFDPEVDYRKVLSTKPHRSHPNHVFYLEDQLWVNRCHQRDCVTVSGPEARIDYSAFGAVGHDGVDGAGGLLLTTVNGYVVEYDRADLSIRRSLDLDVVTGADRPLGWCRGVASTDDGRWLVGFSRMRPTRWGENVSWVKAKIKGSGGPKAPTRIACYDPVAERLDWEIDLEQVGMAEIFSILPLDPSAA